jgi:prevent-host-death family protein
MASSTGQPTRQPTGHHASPETLGVEEARRRLPELLSRAQAGATTLISRHGRPVAALTPLGGRIPTDPMLRQRRLQALLNLQGSGKGCWSAAQHRNRPDSAPEPSQPPAAAFTPQRLGQGDAIAFDGAALVAFLRDARGTAQFLQPLLHGIAQGSWRGVISSLSLAEVLQGPIRQGDEALAQRYAAAFSDPHSWTVVPADAALVQAAVRLQASEPGLPLNAAIELATAIASGAAVLVSDNPELAQTEQHPVLSALRR